VSRHALWAITVETAHKALGRPCPTDVVGRGNKRLLIGGSAGSLDWSLARLSHARVYQVTIDSRSLRRFPLSAIERPAFSQPADIAPASLVHAIGYVGGGEPPCPVPHLAGQRGVHLWRHAVCPMPHVCRSFAQL
jgi:hypothetical protein